MLNLILGRAGTGKTEAVRTMLVNRAKNGGKDLYLIVPEQYSFETEKAILRMAGPKFAAQIQVLSFTRLAEAASRRCGGTAGVPLDDATRRVLMALAFEEAGDHLSLYSDHKNSDKLCEMMLQADTELQMCGIAPEQIGELFPREDDSALPRKLREIALVCSVYRSLAERSFVDPHGDLTRLAEILRENDIFRGATVAVDSFISFTKQELDVLAGLMPQCENMFITLCCDTLDDPTHGTGLFSLVQKTGRKLLRAAKEQGVQPGPITHLDVPYRFANDALRHMEANLFRTPALAFERPAGDAVTLLHPASRFEEAETVAALIRELVMHGSCRYRDISVICRDSDTYAAILRAAFEKREIPCFIDTPRSVDTEPLIRLVLTSFKALSFRSEDILTILKTGLLGVEQMEIAALENYIFTWKIGGSAWKQDFTRHPGGFAGEWKDADREALEQINQVRRRVVGPLLAFDAAARETTGDAICEAVYRLLVAYGVDKALPKLCEQLTADGQFALADEQLRMWDVLVQLLERFHTVLQGRPMPLRRFGELLTAAVEAQTISVIPQGMDEVVFGTAGRIRPSAPKVVFLLGTALGEFPLALSEGGLLTLEERRRLQNMGVELQDPEATGTVGELFLAYAVACAPSERLFISWPAAAGGEETAPGEIPAPMEEMFPGIQTVRRLPEDILSNSPRAAFSRLSARWRENTGETAAMRQYFEENEAYTGRLAAVSRAADDAPAALNEPEVARNLVVSSKFISASQVESFYRCRFGYFCRYSLGIKERLPAELNVMEYGTLMHYLLEHTLQEGAEKFLALSVEERRAYIRALIDRYVEEQLGGAAEMTGRELYRFRRLAQTAETVLLHTAEGLALSKFEPAYFELQLDAREACKPLTIETSAGPVRVGGIVDRVDLYTRGNETFVRIVDYKTGRKEFKLSEIKNGVNLQMLIYLAAIAESTQWSPAGILYMPAAVGAVSAEKGTPEDKLAKEVSAKLKMNGLLQDDPDLLLAMDGTGSGTYLPTGIKNGVADKPEAVVSEKDMALVLSYVKYKVGEMAEELIAGKIPAAPLLVNKNPCGWCPYAGVCLKEYTDEDVRTEKALNKESLEEIRAEFGEEETHGA